jgi:hypothetical protein
MANLAAENTPLERTRCQERAERILNVAEDLLLKHQRRDACHDAR